MILSFVGVYSIHHSPFDLVLMSAFGVLGYLLRKMDFSLVPMVLGLLLGQEMEKSLRRALAGSGEDWSVPVGSPIAVGLYAVTAAMLATAVVLEVRRIRQQRSERVISPERAVTAGED